MGRRQFCLLRLDIYPASCPQHVLGLPVCAAYQYSKLPGISSWNSVFWVKKLERQISKSESICLSESIFPRITGHLVIIENSCNQSKWERRCIINITSVVLSMMSEHTIPPDVKHKIQSWNSVFSLNSVNFFMLNFSSIISLMQE